jgi:hypothetical protein
MDCQQDLAINTLTILDQTCDSSLLCNGNAVFLNSVKIYNNLHLLNDIRLCGNIVPLKHTSSIGTCENPWMDLYVTDGSFNVLNVDTLNVKQINHIHNNDNHQMDNENNEKKKLLNENHIYKYINIDDLNDKYDNVDVIHIYDDDSCELNINIKLKADGKFVFNLNFINDDYKKVSETTSIENILCISDSKIYVNFLLPNEGNKINILIMNPNGYNIKFNKHNVNNNSIDQSYKFVFVDEIKKWLLNYKL